MRHKHMNSVKLPSNYRNAYQINHRGLFLDLALLETDSLLVHEEIVPIRFSHLMRRIKRDGFQSAPVLVDRDTLVVLDGMHRTAVMKELGAQFICVCLLDYFSPSIKIQRWCRVISAPFTEEIAESLLGSMGFSLEPFEDLDRLDEVKGCCLDSGNRHTGSYQISIFWRPSRRAMSWSSNSARIGTNYSTVPSPRQIDTWTLASMRP